MAIFSFIWRILNATQPTPPPPAVVGPSSTLTYKFIAQNQAFAITVAGLVPLTRHFVYFERQRVADALCAPLGGAVGQSLISDISGVLRFTFYYSSGLPAESSSFEALQGMINGAVGVKELSIVSVDQATLDDGVVRGSLSTARTFITINALQPEQVTIVK